MVRPESPTPRRPLAAALLFAVLALSSASPTRAESNTRLDDPTGTVEIQAPGTWRKEKSDHTIGASGFLGVQRAKVFVQVYAGTAAASDALEKWKTWRTSVGETAFTPVEDDALRLVSRARLSTEFVKALAGTGKCAVAWVQIGGSPSGIDDEAFAVLDTLAWIVPKAPEGGEKVEKPAVEPRKVKDSEFRVEFTLPGEFAPVSGERPEGRRFALLQGPIGDDPAARLDLYAFPGFDRVDALIAWWREGERAGWVDASKVETNATGLRVLVEGRTWNRLVHVYPTEAGLYAVKIDVEASAEKEALALLDSLEKGAIRVIAPRKDPPVAPQGFTPVEHATHHVFVEGGAKVDKLLGVIAAAEELVAPLLPLEPWNGRKGEVLVYANQEALDTAVRPYELEKGKVCHWSPSLRRVLTHAGALSAKDAEPLLYAAIARDALHRRLGFPAPFWLDHGIGELAAGAAENKGRLSVPSARWVEGARDAAGGIIDIEALLWWREESSADNKERMAVAWSLVFFLAEGTSTSKKWEPFYKAYLESLRKTGDPAVAANAFPYDRNSELAEELKKRMRKF